MSEIRLAVCRREQTEIKNESAPSSTECYPPLSRVGGASHVTMTTTTPPPTPPEERDKFECLYLLVDTAISRIECERGQPMCN